MTDAAQNLRLMMAACYMDPRNKAAVQAGIDEIERLREKLDARDAQISAIAALVGSEDWPALEQMGRELTLVRSDMLCDLSDIVEQALQTKNTCEVCSGLQTLDGEHPCPVCDGIGTESSPACELTLRERWLMREAFKAGNGSYDSLDQWLSDPVCDSGLTVEDAILHELRQQSEKGNG